VASTSSTAAKPRWSLADKTPLLLNLAGKDRFVDPEIPAFVDLVRQSGLKAEIFSYENTERGFDDDNDSAHYSAGAATLAWSRTIEFLQVTLHVS